VNGRQDGEAVRPVQFRLCSHGFSRCETAILVEQVLSEIGDAFVRGESVKLSGFGTFTVWNKAERVSRNPKTGVEVPFDPRRAVTFSASQVLREHVNGAK